MVAASFAALVLAARLGCTTLIAGRDATADGSVMASHSNDGEANVDPRLVHVPARDNAPGSHRPIYWSPETYPRYVGHARNVPAYFPTGSQQPWEPIGKIDEVPHTFAYHEQTYGALNEHGVGIGESTCSAVFSAMPRGRGGKALFSIDQLTQLAMERATTSREAVTIMGELAVAHGFYGANNATEGSAESLMVIDPEEAFIFHILPDDTGASAIWVAQRVPDDHGVCLPCCCPRVQARADSALEALATHLPCLAVAADGARAPTFPPPPFCRSGRGRERVHGARCRPDRQPLLSRLGEHARHRAAAQAVGWAG